RRVAPANDSSEDARSEPKILEAGTIRVDVSAHEVTVGDTEAKLTLREFDLLRFRRENPHTALSREDLLRRVWGWEFDGGSRTVDVHIQTLRSKLGDEAARIETVRGVGYRFED
ncbi:MAG: winged helix-turn-helix transcriptional regulator, partial [Atopobiaceae bacterium]|nr:winged helix-turn-helix transcriptional regulator [Atopobiaceae bacterium]